MNSWQSMKKTKRRLLRLDALLDDIEEVLRKHSSSFEIMSVDGDEDGLTFTVSAEYLKKEVDNRSNW